MTWHVIVFEPHQFGSMLELAWWVATWWALVNCFRR